MTHKKSNAEKPRRNSTKNEDILPLSTKAISLEGYQTSPAVEQGYQTSPAVEHQTQLNKRPSGGSTEGYIGGELNDKKPPEPDKIDPNIAILLEGYQTSPAVEHQTQLNKRPLGDSTEGYTGGELKDDDAPKPDKIDPEIA